MTDTRPRVFSGIQPTGTLTIANYAGALKSWRTLQETADCIFCIVDLHTLTVARDPALLRERCHQFLALYLACGIDPSQSVLFLQSQNPHHAELTWILSCFASVGQLQRMTQYKDKAAHHSPNAGLLCYPVLMSADILLYDTDEVPVGDDQVQHVELTRDLAERVNSRLGEVFVLPTARTPKTGARSKNLLDPSRKMDKSSDNPKTYIALTDPPELVRRKIRSATTSPDPTYDITDSNSGVANLVSLMSVVTDRSPAAIAQEYEGTGFGTFKKDLAEAVVAHLAPIQSAYRRLRSDEAHLSAIVADGAERAVGRSEPKIALVKERLGLR